MLRAEDMRKDFEGMTKEQLFFALNAVCDMYRRDEDRMNRTNGVIDKENLKEQLREFEKMTSMIIELTKVA